MDNHRHAEVYFNDNTFNTNKPLYEFSVLIKEDSALVKSAIVLIFSCIIRNDILNDAKQQVRLLLTAFDVPDEKIFHRFS